MGRALFLADKARENDDVPVGAVVLDSTGRIVGQGWNQRELDHDPSAHAEIVAMRDAGRRLGRWNLVGCTLVVTLEPCTMCAGAIVQARIDRVVFAAWDPKAGAAGSVRDVLRDSRLNHQVEVIGGVLQEEAAIQLRGFFSDKRRIETPGAVRPASAVPDRGPALRPASAPTPPVGWSDPTPPVQRTAYALGSGSSRRTWETGGRPAEASRSGVVPASARPSAVSATAATRASASPSPSTVPSRTPAPAPADRAGSDVERTPAAGRPHPNVPTRAEQQRTRRSAARGAEQPPWIVSGGAPAPEPAPPEPAPSEPTDVPELRVRRHGHGAARH